MRRAVFVFMVLFGGCAATEQSPSPRENPELISMTPLPLLPQRFIFPGQDQRRLHSLFCLRTDGTVAEVRLLSLTGDTAWDRAAVDSMRHWRFAPLTTSIDEDHLWVRRELIVKAQDPIVMSIGELIAGSKHEADSLYQLLRQGASFGRLAETPVDFAVQWRPSLVDIACYPGQIREKLVNLDVNDITVPIRLGNRYVIYKRFEVARAEVPQVQ